MLTVASKKLNSQPVYRPVVLSVFCLHLAGVQEWTFRSSVTVHCLARHWRALCPALW